MRIRKAQKHKDPTDPDPEHWFCRQNPSHIMIPKGLKTRSDGQALNKTWTQPILFYKICWSFSAYSGYQWELDTGTDENRLMTETAEMF